MDLTPLDFNSIPSARKIELEKIERYDLFKTMYYRTNLWQHSHRVMWLVEDVLETKGDYLEVDHDKARVMAYIHDDPEIIITDIAGPRKDQMSKREKDEYHRAEEDAAKEIGRWFGPKICGYDYAELLLDMSRLVSPESQLVNFLDKAEAHSETMHEMFAGNYTFTFATCHTVRKLTSLKRDMPHLENFVRESKHPFAEFEVQVPMTGQFMITKDSNSPFMKPHTRDSLKDDVKFYPHYDHWRKVMQEKGGESAVLWLTEQKESFYSQPQ